MTKRNNRKQGLEAFNEAIGNLVQISVFCIGISLILGFIYFLACVGPDLLCMPGLASFAKGFAVISCAGFGSAILLSIAQSLK